MPLLMPMPVSAHIRLSTRLCARPCGWKGCCQADGGFTSSGVTCDAFETNFRKNCRRRAVGLRRLELALTSLCRHVSRAECGRMWCAAITGSTCIWGLKLVSFSIIVSKSFLLKASVGKSTVYVNSQQSWPHAGHSTQY